MQTLTCCSCYQTFPFSPREQAFYREKGYQIPKRCKSCRTKKKKFKHPPMEHISKWIECIDCGCEFCITSRDEAFYERKGYQIPKRCKPCRYHHKFELESSTSDWVNCIDCDKSFSLTGRQSKVYNEKGHRNAPPWTKWCRECAGLHKQYHKNIEHAFDNNCIGEAPKGIVHCKWCGNPGHGESYCQFKESATCKTCGAVGSPGSAGFASGIRTNTYHMPSCGCSPP